MISRGIFRTPSNIIDIWQGSDRSSRPQVFCKKGILRNIAKFTGKHLHQSLFLIKLQAEAYASISCEFCEISKNTPSYKTPPVAASFGNTSLVSISVFSRWTRIYCTVFLWTHSYPLTLITL